MRANPNLQFTVIEPQKKSLNDFIQMLKQVFVNLIGTINGHIGFGDGTLPDNVDGSWVNVTSPVAPDTDFTVNHNLSRVPVGYVPMQKNKAGDVYTGSVPATLTQLTLRCSAASVTLRLFVVSLLLTLFSIGAMAQSTNISATVTDTDGQTWNNGTYHIVFVPNPTFPGATYTWTGGAFDPITTYDGALSSGGVLTQTVPSNNAISPTGTQWSIQVCPNATGVCFTNVFTLNGSSPTITPPAIRINASPGAVAYTDAEVKSGLGGIYYNIGSQLLRLCLVSSGGLCSSWTNVGGGGPGGVPRLDQVLDPNVNKTFNLGTTTLAFINGSVDLSNLTSAIKLPVVAGCTTASAGQICYDSTVGNWVVFNGANSIIPTLLSSGTYTTGDVLGISNVAGALTLTDLGPVGGTSGSSFVQVTTTNILNNDSICWNGTNWVNCTAGVPVTVITATSYTVNCLTDRGVYLLFTASSPIAVSLPPAATSGNCDANFFTFIRTINATLTVTPTISTINDGGGAGATLVMSAGYGFTITSDNSNYTARGGPYRESGNPLMSTEGFDVNTIGGYDWQAPNNASPGTILNKMACDDGTGKVQTCAFATSTTNDPVGVAVNGIGATPGTTGNTAVCFMGFCTVTFDNTATANHFAQLSSSVNGDLHDTGATTPPTNGQPYWYVFSGNGGAGTNAVIRNLAPRELNATAGGGKTTVQINGVNTQPIANFTTSGGVTLTPINSGNTTTIAFTISGGGVTSLTCDNTLLNCSSSTGAVTQSRASATSGTVYGVSPIAATGKIVQHTTGSASTSSVVKAYGTNTTAGNLLVAFFWVNGGGGVYPTVTDTQLNTWQQGDINNSWSMMYVCSNAGGADTVTANFGGSSVMIVELLEITGNVNTGGATACLDTHGSSSAGSGTIASASTANPLSQPDILLFGAANTGSGATYTPGVGMTSLDFVSGPASITVNDFYANNFQNSGTQTLTAKLSVTSAWRAIIGAFKMANVSTTPAFINITSSMLPVTPNFLYASDTLAQTSALADTPMFTVGSISSMFRFTGIIDCTTSSASATATMNLKWTDDANTAETATAVATCTTLGTNSSASLVQAIRAKNATSITIGVTIANTPTYDISARLEQM